MKLRHKTKGHIAYSGRFNTSSVSEIIVMFENGEGDSDFQSNWDAWIEAKGEWKDLQQAFHDHDIIRDNYNTRFFEPTSDEDRERGFSP